MNVEKAIRDFIVKNFMFGQDGKTLDKQQSFLNSGIVDSTGVLELVTFIEETFGLRVLDQEIVPENLDSIAQIQAFVARKTKQPESVPEQNLF
ncbi:acyl carrier protein [candidate division KSB1 bacterium]|nr:acyl carrier protein [candidate division KSB1 bacterium]